MTFNKFAQLLYPYIGNGQKPADFVIELTTNIIEEIDDENSNPLLELETDTLTRIFKGTKDISKKNASIILSRFDKTLFIDYLLKIPNDTIDLVINDMENNGISVVKKDFYAICADTFASILRDIVSNSKNNVAKDIKEDTIPESNNSTIHGWIDCIKERITLMTCDNDINENRIRIFTKIVLLICLSGGINIDNIKELLPKEFNRLEKIAEKRDTDVWGLCRYVMGINHNRESQIEQCDKDFKRKLQKVLIDDRINVNPDLCNPNINLDDIQTLKFCVETLKALETDRERELYIWCAVEINPFAVSNTISRMIREKLITEEDELYPIITCYSIPEGRKVVAPKYGLSAFEPLRKLKLSSTVTEFSNEIIRDLGACKSLSTFEAYINEVFSANETDSLYSKSKIIDNKYVPKNCLFKVASTVTGEYEVRETVDEIGDFCFSGCKLITKITIPKEVKYIGLSAFSDCYSLAEVDFCGDVDYLHDNAFENCKSLKRIDLPNGIEKLFCGTFKGCPSLEYVYVPDTVLQIGKPEIEEKSGYGECVFGGCSEPTGLMKFLGFTKISELINFFEALSISTPSELLDVSKISELPETLHFKLTKLLEFKQFS